MKYVLHNDKWEVTYIDSTNVERSFFYPTQIKNLLKFIEEGVKELTPIDDKKIKEIFSSDLITENIVNSTTLLEEPEIWAEDPVLVNQSEDTLVSIMSLDNQQSLINKLNERIDILELQINQLLLKQ